VDNQRRVYSIYVLGAGDFVDKGWKSVVGYDIRPRMDIHIWEYCGWILRKEL